MSYLCNFWLLVSNIIAIFEISAYELVKMQSSRKDENL